jgi:glutamate---cysteine ligase / carboxylate-amine ligase
MTDVSTWSTWRSRPSSEQLTIGIEEEFMLLDPDDWSLAFRSDEVRTALPPGLRDRVTLETHAAAMEIATGVHRRVSDAVAELAQLRGRLAHALAAQGLRAAVAGIHPCAVADDTVLSSHPRYRDIGDSLRVLARREPTLATHVHVGVASPSRAIRLFNRLRAHLPLLLALSANSPFWQGRSTGFASTRTTLLDAFPRSGLPRGFRNYADWVATVERLLGAGAIADPSFLWWDVRLQPRYGTVEVRIMDGQSTVEDVAAVAALVQALASLELERGEDPGPEPRSHEVIEENRFLAARDGMAALLIDERSAERIPAIERLERTLGACCRHARRLRCERELASVRRLVARNGAMRQLAHACRDGDLRHVAARLADAYAPRRYARPVVREIPRPAAPAGSDW